MIVATTTAQLGTRLAVFGFVFFVGLSSIDRLPRLSDRPPGPYIRGRLRAARMLIPVSLVLGVIGLVLWVVAR